jgi:hypothetical protein
MNNTLDIKECLGELYDNTDYRKLFFEEYGYNNDALRDPATSIRLDAYRALRFTPATFNDESTVVRLEAYRTIGYTTDAFKDRSHIIRLEAYEALGYTDDAVNDDDYAIAVKARGALAKRRAQKVVDQLEDGVEVQFILKFEEGYLADEQDEYHYQYTDKVKKARMYKTISGAAKTGSDVSGDNQFEIITLITQQKYTIA